jgi:hypothetical protein
MSKNETAAPAGRRVLLRALELHMQKQRAIDLAWRWFRRNQAPVISLSEFIARVRRNFPEANEAEVRSELARRVSRSRFTPRRHAHERAS